MYVRRSGLVLVLVLLLAGCGGDKEGSGGGDSAGGSTPSTRGSSGSAKGVRPHPLVSLTEARLDEYLAILKDAAADPEKDDGQIAMARGWKIMDWVMLDASIKQVVAAGGFDEHLERIRSKSAEVSRQIEGYETEASSKPKADREIIEKAVATLRGSVEGWTRTLGQADAMRAGGELIEGRMADIKAATGK